MKVAVPDPAVCSEGEAQGPRALSAVGEQALDPGSGHGAVGGRTAHGAAPSSSSSTCASRLDCSMCSFASSGDRQTLRAIT